MPNVTDTPENAAYRRFFCGRERYHTSITAKAHIDRNGTLVADLSRNKDDWAEHVAEVVSHLKALSEVLTRLERAGDRATVDVGVYARTRFDDGVAVAVDVYRFPPSALRLLSDYSLTLEVSVNTISPD
jgi:hypothetical protein